MLRSSFMLGALCVGFSLSAQEVCNNGIDDDANGLVDLNDPACACSTALIEEGTPSYIHNHSFEDQVMGPNGPCCPYGLSTDPPNYLSCADGWHQATNSTSDYYHSCGLYPDTYPFPPPDGTGSVGFLTIPGWYEYVGTCLMLPADDPHPLLAGVTYTLSLWVTMMGTTMVNAEDIETFGAEYSDPFPLALFASNTCQAFPLPTYTCVGEVPGWFEIGRVQHEPNGQWSRVSFTFTPTAEIRSIIIGTACNPPACYTIGTYLGPDGTLLPSTPMTLVDDLMLTLADDQVLTPVINTGDLCNENVIATATPPPSATDHQWYRDGVAIVGQTGLQLNVSALQLGAGVYALASTYNGECLMGSTNVAEPVVAFPAFMLEPATGCQPLTVSFTDTTGTSIASSVWDFGDNQTATGAEVEHTYTAAGTYDITLTVTDTAGCSRERTVPDAVVVAPSPVAAISATPNPMELPNSTALLSGTASGADILAWWWDLGTASPSGSTEQDLTVTFPPEAGTYPVLLAVRTPEGCVDTVRSSVIVRADGALDMPNVFSPNGDGHNDRFLPMDVLSDIGKLEVYNRWGQLVFTTNSIQGGWDGRIAGSLAPEGTYYYVVYAGEGSENLTGHVTLVR